MTPSRDISRLIEIMAALRTPKTGCPWDLEQDFTTIAPYTIEEAYEGADAIARHDFADVVEAITAKLIRRHPHVFGDARDLTPEAVEDLWHDIKAQEKAAKAEKAARSHDTAATLADVPVALPALTRALKLQQKAAKVGFDWNDPRAVLAKIREEADEIEAALAAGDAPDAAAESGDLLFAVVNLARHLDADPEGVLRATNRKFERRFAFIERALGADGKQLAQATLTEMDALWDAAKVAEREAAAASAT